MSGSDLHISYENHDRVVELVERLQYILEGISLAFDRWGEPHIKGPGLYIAIVTGPSVADFADPMGDNQWPIVRCRDAYGDLDTVFETTEDVARSRDGAVVISVDGVIQERMVRFNDLLPGEAATADGDASDYEDWMGSRHMSALDTSRRANVTATLTVSEETGRVTRFQRGRFTTYERPALGAKWNPLESS